MPSLRNERKWRCTGVEGSGVATLGPRRAQWRRWVRNGWQREFSRRGPGSLASLPPALRGRAADSISLVSDQARRARGWGCGFPIQWRQVRAADLAEGDVTAGGCEWWCKFADADVPVFDFRFFKLESKPASPRLSTGVSACMWMMRMCSAVPTGLTRFSIRWWGEFYTAINRSQQHSK